MRDVNRSTAVVLMHYCNSALVVCAVLIAEQCCKWQAIEFSSVFLEKSYKRYSGWAMDMQKLTKFRSSRREVSGATK